MLSMLKRSAVLASGEKPALTFTRRETQYRLSSIWESGSDGRAIVDR
jgi:hypothetical protein